MIELVLSALGGLSLFEAGSSLIAVSARKGSGRGLVALFMPELRLLVFPPTAPTLARFLSSFSRNRSLELMYINPLWLRPVFLPQLSCDRCLLNSGGGDAPATPRSMDRLPMLWVSASRDASDPFDDGLEALLRPLKMLFRPPFPSRAGDLGAVRGEKPLGGLAVRMTGGLAASSLISASSSRSPSRGEWWKAP